MRTPRFTQNNESFVCIECGREVPLHPIGSRDHCNACLTGLHVDVFPGDRMNDCGGVLRPIGIQTKNNKTRIVYRCESCHAQIFALAAPDDDENLIAELFRQSW